MQFTRRELVRKLGGVVVAGVVFSSGRLLLKESEETLATEAAKTVRAGKGTTISSIGSTVNRDGSLASASSPNSLPNSPLGTDTTIADLTSTTQASTTSTTGASTTTTTNSTSDPTTATTAPGSTPTTDAVVIGDLELTGAVGPVLITKGTTATIVGDVQLKGDLVVEGLLNGVDTFTLQGNGHQIEVRNGGRVDLQGKPKTGWTRGGSPSGWNRGDRVVTAPNGNGRYAISDFKVGSWPVASPSSVTLLNGRRMPAEQINLDRSIVIDGVSKIIFLDGAGKQILKHIAVRNAGIKGQPSFFPIHFHRNGSSTRGSLVEGVVVENGQNHAFVPHGSHGITFIDCAAVNTIDMAYWWNKASGGDTSNNSDDIVWKDCIALGVTPSDGRGNRLAAFQLGGGRNNSAIGCVAVGVQGRKDASGFIWPEFTGGGKNNPDGVWNFRNCVAHNNKNHGIFVWQNTSEANFIEEFVAYRNGGSGVDHGAYGNRYRYANSLIQESGKFSIEAHALGREGLGPVFENIVTDGLLLIGRHHRPKPFPVTYRSVNFTGVVVNEDSDEPSLQIFHDCGMTPQEFDFVSIRPGTVIEIYEEGQLRFRWSGTWSA